MKMGSLVHSCWEFVKSTYSYLNLFVKRYLKRYLNGYFSYKFIHEFLLSFNSSFNLIIHFIWWYKILIPSKRSQTHWLINFFTLMVDSYSETTEMEHDVLVFLTIINDSVLWKWNSNHWFISLFQNNSKNNILFYKNNIMSNRTLIYKQN